MCVCDDSWSLPLTGHIQYISTIVKDKMPECRREFGVQFMIDVIRIFYRSVETCLVISGLWLIECSAFPLSSAGSTVPISVGEGLKLSEEEEQSIRAAIFMSMSV